MILKVPSGIFSVSLLVLFICSVEITITSARPNDRLRFWFWPTSVQNLNLGKYSFFLKKTAEPSAHSETVAGSRKDMTIAEARHLHYL